MTARPVLRAVAGGVTRRKVQTFVIGLVLLASSSAAVLALALLVDSTAPFDHAFAAQHGAHVVATVDPAGATPGELAATRRLPEVTAAAGPFGEVTVALKQAGLPLPPTTLAGRASPGGPLDDLTLQSGHWAQRPGQMVLSSDPSPGTNTSMPLGTRLTVTGVPGTRTLTIVGIASSVNSSADGWVLPGEIAKLRTPPIPAAAQMLYRFADAGSAAAVRADVAAVTRALPRGTVTGTQSYLAVRAEASSNIAPFVPFVVAFAALGLVMSVLIVTNVVSGAVVAGYRRIGILKSIGFSPGQVVAAYTAQAGVPAVAGCLGGVVLGNVLAVPVLGQAANVYGVGSLRVPAWVDAAVPVAMCALVGIAALLPALRAGRLSAVQAIAAGRAPRQGRGYAAHRLLGRLPLPRPVTIGLAAPFARPTRTAVTLVAVLLGVTAVTLAVGLSASLNRLANGLSLASTVQVQVTVPSAVPGGPPVAPVPGRGGPPVHLPTPAAAERAVTTALQKQPGTARYIGLDAGQMVSVAGLSRQVALTAFRGDARWIGYAMVSGHWYTGPGQVDVASGFLNATGKVVGDTITINVGGKQITARIVGQVFNVDNNGLGMFTDWRTLVGAERGLEPDQYDVGLRPGTSPAAYARALGVSPAYGASVAGADATLPLVLGLIGTLTLLLAVVAGLGVLNTVVLHTRDRAAPPCAARHGRGRQRRPASQLPARLRRRGDGGAGSGRAGDRGGRSADPGGLGRQDRHRRGAAHRVRRAVRGRD